MLLCVGDGRFKSRRRNHRHRHLPAMAIPFRIEVVFRIVPGVAQIFAILGARPLGICANTGVAAVADSSTAAARALNEIIFSFLRGPISGLRGTRRIDHAARGERDVQTSSNLLAASGGYLDDGCRGPHAGPTKFHFNKFNSA